MDQGRGKRKNVIKMISVSSTSGSSSNPEAVIGAESMGMRVIQKKSGQRGWWNWVRVRILECLTKSMAYKGAAIGMENQ